MKQSAIIAAAAVALASPAIDLFEITPAVEGNQVLGNGKHGKPRVANDAEIVAYARFLADRAGLTRFEDYRHEQQGAITFGKRTAESRWENVERPCYETFTMKAERVHVPVQYETGAYSVPFPGRNGPGPVTMETLSPEGEVCATQTLPVEPKKLGVMWDRDAVRWAVGPVQKPARARKARSTPTATPPAAENVPHGPENSPIVDVEAVGEAIGALIAGLSDRIASLEARVDGETRNAPAVDEGLAARVAELEAENARLSDGWDSFYTQRYHLQRDVERYQARLRRVLTRATAMRRRHALDVAALMEGRGFTLDRCAEVDELKARLAKAERRADDAEFKAVDLETRLAAAELAATAAATIYEPQLDAKQSRIVALQNELIELKSGGRIKMPKPAALSPLTGASVIAFPVAASR